VRKSRNPTYTIGGHRVFTTIRRAFALTFADFRHGNPRAYGFVPDAVINVVHYDDLPCVGVF
jgi:hypothetical protein